MHIAAFYWAGNTWSFFCLKFLIHSKFFIFFSHIVKFLFTPKVSLDIRKAIELYSVQNAFGGLQCNDGGTSISLLYIVWMQMYIKVTTH